MDWNTTQLFIHIYIYYTYYIWWLFDQPWNQDPYSNNRFFFDSWLNWAFSIRPCRTLQLRACLGMPTTSWWHRPTCEFTGMKVSNWVWRGSNTPPVEVGSFFPWFFEGLHPRCWIFSINSIQLDYPDFLGRGGSNLMQVYGKPLREFLLTICASYNDPCSIGLLWESDFGEWFDQQMMYSCQASSVPRGQAEPEGEVSMLDIFGIWRITALRICCGCVLDVRYFETCCWSKKSQTTTWDANKTIKPWK